MHHQLVRPSWWSRAWAVTHRQIGIQLVLLNVHHQPTIVVNGSCRVRVLHGIQVVVCAGLDFSTVPGVLMHVS